MIGQLGPKRCGDIQQETWIASSSGNSNLMMLKFDAKFANDKSPKKGFKIKATTIGRGKIFFISILVDCSLTKLKPNRWCTG